MRYKMAAPMVVLGFISACGGPRVSSLVQGTSVPGGEVRAGATDDGPQEAVSSTGPCFQQANIVQMSTDELSDETRDVLLSTLVGNGLIMRAGNLFVNTNRSYIVSAEIQGPGYEGNSDIVTWVVRTTARMVPEPSEVELLGEGAVDAFGWELTRVCVERALAEVR